MPQSDYKRKPGKSGRYVNKRTGNEISRRAYENLAAKENGFKNYYQYQQLAKDDRFKFYAEAYANKQGVSYQKAKGLKSELTQLFQGAENEEWDASPRGAFAQLLVAVGCRDYDWVWNVGDTPTGEGIC